MSDGATNAADWRVPTQELVPRWGLGDVWATLLLAQVAGAVVYVVFAFNGVDAEIGWPLIVTAASGWAVMAGWPIVASRRKGNGPVRDFGLRVSRLAARIAIGGFLAAVAAASVAAWVITRVSGPFESVAGQLALQQHGVVLWVFAAATVLLAPVCEEIAFRGLLYGALEKRGMGDVPIVFVSAALFAAYHVEPTRFPLLFALGLALGEVRRRTGSTGAAIMTHVGINFLPAVAMVVGR